MSDIKIFAGRANEPLAKAIAAYVEDKIWHDTFERKTVLGVLDDRRNFNDGEIYVRYGENIRGKDVFIVQPTNQPDTHLWELEMMIHTARLASAERITAVIPYLGYSRQDWKDKSRAPVTVSVIARLLWASGVDRVVLLDAHSNVVVGAFAALNVSSDHLWVRPVFVKYLEARQSEWCSSNPLVIVAPDIHAGRLARAYAKNLEAEGIAVIEKTRPNPGEARVLNVVGDVGGKDALIVDDMIDSAKTTSNAAEALRDRGARNIFALAAHGVFSGDALERVENSPIKFLFVTDSIHLPSAVSSKTGKLRIVSVAGLLGEAIFRIHKNQSVSSLFE
ncbi:MAG: hypothetical protein A3G49_00240 [Candidatus Sungbacteria bacterium RIFCSPLOWO2_12_FULL_41_11]|uniref:ribose-phosphate diphosphokinase n=1 Tax=Candidatus Sungbacteria bacterium RIFCSPLOWO2_12_FULL_41_11 TaxID=1802286 RepID=A0A1G2LP73_9BACT|nr:MAG: Ribose-phosphate pyrophosphokinase [Parcubacteria group bacterium GW2011_GWA2_42_14]OGZ98214.1 MAG: hypothetical protein A3D41_02910 [Candidatus Sungbacteria bacterium RIFCSPHIGHO2_02_FULL_41_12b]OHA12689.1 MAG: hypothetical protein A3G49_00240 [Candidatus Sungbacteria bacterium RIFCSPLOWO2_12_FULL_41_11]